MMSDGNKRKTLGRGLSSLLGEAAKGVAVATGGRAAVMGPSGMPLAAATVSDSGSGLRMLPIEFLKPGKYQPRHVMDPAQIADLANSIREKGILQPILVRHDGGGTDSYEIIAGERRWRAAQEAQLHEVPVLVRDLSDQETLEIALIENLQRQDLSPLEEAQGYRRLMDDFSHGQEALSKAVGKSRSHVANMMRLLSLPTPVKDMLDDGRLSAGHARTLIGTPDAETLAIEIIKKGLNVRQTEKLVKAAQGGKIGSTKSGPGTTKGAATPTKDTDTLALERDLTNMLGLKVEITFDGGKGALSVHYDSLEQLDDILHRLSHGAHGSPTGSSDD